MADFAPPKPVRCRSVGWVLHRDEECIVLTQNRGDEHSPDDEQFCGAMVIPQCAVTKTTSLPIPNSACCS